MSSPKEHLIAVDYSVYAKHPPVVTEADWGCPGDRDPFLVAQNTKVLPRYDNQNADDISEQQHKLSAAGSGAAGCQTSSSWVQTGQEACKGELSAGQQHALFCIQEAPDAWI